MRVPLNSLRYASSRNVVSASRWFVGSSRRRTSGLERSSRAIATLRRSPPERTATDFEPSGQPRSAILRSTRFSRFQ